MVWAIALKLVSKYLVKFYQEVLPSIALGTITAIGSYDYGARANTQPGTIFLVTPATI